MDKKEYDDVIIIMEMEYKEKEKYVLSLSCVFLYNKPAYKKC